MKTMKTMITIIKYLCIILQLVLCTPIVIEIIKKESFDIPKDFKGCKSFIEKLFYMIFVLIVFTIIICFIESPVIGTIFCLIHIYTKNEREEERVEQEAKEKTEKDKKEMIDLQNLYDRIRKFNFYGDSNIVFPNLSSKIDEIFYKYLKLKESIVYKGLAMNRIVLAFTLIEQSHENGLFGKDNRKLNLEFSNSIDEVNNFYNELLLSIKIAKDEQIKQDSEFAMLELNKFKDATNSMRQDFKKINDKYFDFVNENMKKEA